jgi:hypothetical protein
MKDHRTKGFSSLIKRRFIIGSYVLQAWIKIDISRMLKELED